MPIRHLDHFTLRCGPEELEALRRFYVDVLGLVDGVRADFDFPGHWLYAGSRAVVHLAANAAPGAGTPHPSATGRLDHVAFFTSELAVFRERLRRHGIAFREAPVPGMPLHQVFLNDPTGLDIELTFGTADEP